ncbi:MAG: tetratricopeptide (TPR) repeat protein [bacterium]|jgi:tetratricopeptide (TPR) repeat protein
MIKLIYYFSLAVIFSIIIQTVAIAKTVQSSQDKIFASFPTKIKKQAIRYEKRKQWILALQRWEMVRSFRPTDKDAYKKVVQLQEKIAKIADDHFKSGVSYYFQGKAWPAMKKFIKTLSYEPNNRLAFDYIKNELVGKEFTDHEVQEKETLRSVSDEEYGSKKYDFLIAYFNNLSVKEKLKPGTRLQIPILAGIVKVVRRKSTKKKVVVIAKKDDEEESSTTEDEDFNSEKAILTIKQLIRNNKLSKALEEIENLLDKEDDNKEGMLLKNKVSYTLGLQAEKTKQFTKAVEFYQQIDGVFKDIKTRIAKLQKQILHKKNQSYYTLGKKQEKKNLLAAAMIAYKKVDSQFKDVSNVIKSLIVLIKNLSDEHYKKGVAFAANDDYEKAIKEYKSALQIKPDFSQAQESLKEAVKIWEQLKKL